MVRGGFKLCRIVPKTGVSHKGSVRMGGINHVQSHPIFFKTVFLLIGLFSGLLINIQDPTAISGEAEKLLALF